MAQNDVKETVQQDTAKVSNGHAPARVETALAYAHAGVPTFPVRIDAKPGGGWSKKPLTAAAGGYGDARWGASADPDTVRRAWADKKRANAVGRPTGNGVVVFDADTYKGAAIPAELPPTRTATTRSGGRHLYYAVPADVHIPSTEGVYAPGVDVRGDGGYIVAVGTPGYAWIDAEVPIAELPAELLERVARKNRRAGAGRMPAVTYVAPGERWAHLQDLGVRLTRAGLTSADAIERVLLVEWDAVCDDTQHDPDQTRDDIRRYAEWIAGSDIAQREADEAAFWAAQR
jgi:hypothetical protein